MFRFFIAALIVESCLVATKPIELHRAPLYGADHPDRVLGSYLVQFQRNATYTLDEHWQAIGMNLSSFKGFTYLHRLPGYTVSQINGSSVDLIRKDHVVSFVQADRLFYHDRPLNNHYTHGLTGSPSLTPIFNVSQIDVDEIENPNFSTLEQNMASWNLAVVGAGGKLETPVPDWKNGYYYMSRPGLGVKIYLFDAGMNIHDPAFGDQATPFTDPKDSWDDNTGHGIHVAGIAVADNVGIARKAHIVSVKLISDDGMSSHNWAVKAYTAALREHQQDLDQQSQWDFRGSVWLITSISNRRPPRWPLEQKIIESYEQLFNDADSLGITIIATAGNRLDDVTDPMDAKLVWPCYYSAVICVGSIDADYHRMIETYGPYVDFLAPGHDVVTTEWEESSSEGNFGDVVSGTSFAASHVAGVAALFRSWKGRAERDIKGLLRLNAIEGVCSGVPEGQPNLLINTGILRADKLPDMVPEPFIRAGTAPFMPEDCEDDSGSEEENMVERRLLDEL